MFIRWQDSKTVARRKRKGKINRCRAASGSMASQAAIHRFPAMPLEITTMSSRTVWVWVAIRVAAAAAWDGGPGLLEPARLGGPA
jgi:hypothetical protein